VIHRLSGGLRPLSELSGAIVLVLFLVMMIPAPAAAQEYPKAIQGAIDSGAEVVKQFPAASGLTGWVLQDEWSTSIIYTTADKKTVIVGRLISEDGQDLNALYAKLHVPAPDLSDLYGELERAAYVVEGPIDNPRSIIYVFVDANCPYCHFTWRALQAYEQAGPQVRWLLVWCPANNFTKPFDLLQY
jgi:thiol:disulfide interchange protein DsbG